MIGCALTFRYAVETFNERFNIDTSFSIDSVNKVIADLRNVINGRDKNLTHIIESLSRASVLNKRQATREVISGWLDLQAISIDKSFLQKADSDLAKSIIRIQESQGKQKVLQVWDEDRGTVWRRRIFYRKIRPSTTKTEIMKSKLKQSHSTIKAPSTPLCTTFNKSSICCT